MTWQIHDTKAGVSEFLKAALEKGNRLHGAVRPSLKALLLTPDERIERLAAKGRKLCRRPALEID